MTSSTPNNFICHHSNSPVQFVEDIYTNLGFHKEISKDNAADGTPSADCYDVVSEPHHIVYTRNLGKTKKSIINTVCVSLSPSEEMKDFIMSNFDADICSLTFDGTGQSIGKMRVLYEDILCRLITFTINKKYKENTVKQFHDLDNYVIRPESFDHDRARFVSTCKRIKKYNERGFLVRVVFT